MSSPGGALPGHGPLRIIEDGRSVALQPAGAAGSAVDTLLIDLHSGSASTFQKEAFPATAPEVLGVLGVLKLPEGEPGGLQEAEPLCSGVHGCCVCAAGRSYT